MQVGFLTSQDMVDPKSFAKKVRAIAKELNGPYDHAEVRTLEIWAWRAHANRVGRNPLSLLVWILHQPFEKRIGLLTDADWEQGSQDSKSLKDARERYQRFLRSEEWAHIRRTKLKSVGYTCERCGEKCARRDVDVHHKHYGRPWSSERIDDLEVLCRPCHANQHGIRNEHPVRGWSTLGLCIDRFFDKLFDGS